MLACIDQQAPRLEHLMKQPQNSYQPEWSGFFTILMSAELETRRGVQYLWVVWNMRTPSADIVPDW